MRFSLTIPFFAILATLVEAQTPASDAEVAQVSQAIVNVVTAVGSLDQTVIAYAGPADTPTLQAASDNVVDVLNAGVVTAAAVQGTISINQGVTLLDPVNTLNTAVNTTVTDVINKRALLVSSCLGPTILAALQQQLVAASALSQAIGNKVDPTIRDFALSLAQPSIDSLNQALQAYASEASLPAGCQATSSAAIPSTSSSAVTSSTAVTTSAAAVVSSSGIAVVSSSPVSSVPTPTIPAPASSRSEDPFTSTPGPIVRSTSGSVCTSPVTRSAALRTYTSTVTCPDGHVSTTTVTLCRSACNSHPYVTTSTCPDGQVTTYTVTPAHYGTASMGSAGVLTKPASPSATATMSGKPPSYTGGAALVAAEFNVLALLGAAAAVIAL